MLRDFPNIITFCIAGFIGGLGFQLGYILYCCKKQNGDYKILKQLEMQSKLGWKQLAVWVPVLLFTTIVLFLGTQFIGAWLLDTYFNWLPEWYFLQANYSVYSTEVQIVTYFFLFIFVALIIPIVEELFFRGFLLPRMAWMGK